MNRSYQVQVTTASFSHRDEDRFVVLTGNKGATLVILSDGAGGRPDGAKIANHLIHTLLAEVVVCSWTSDDLSAAIRRSIRQVHTLKSLHTIDPDAWATLVMALVTQNEIMLWLAGDSVVQMLDANDKHLTLNLPSRGIPFVGQDGILSEPMQPPTYLSVSPVQEGGRLIVASDGITRPNWVEKIKKGEDPDDDVTYISITMQDMFLQK